MKRWRWVPGDLSSFGNGYMADIRGNGYGAAIEYDVAFRDNIFIGAPMEIASLGGPDILGPLCLKLPEGEFTS